MRTAFGLSCAFALIGCGDNLHTTPGDASPPGFATGSFTAGESGGTDAGSDAGSGGTDAGGTDAGCGQVATPRLAFVSATSRSVAIEVCAGPTGLPGGFTLEWTRDADGWSCTGGNCSATFTGPTYALAADACVTIEVGRLFDAGPTVSFTCDELACATDYKFHAWGLPSDTCAQSATSDELCASTLACITPRNCTLTQGYWKNHDAWPVSEVALGSVIYVQAEMLAIFDTPARGNGLVSLAHQLAAARLNIAAGADPTAATSSLAGADALIGSLVVPPIGTGYLAPAMASPLVDALADYNEGKTGPGHCDP